MPDEETARAPYFFLSYAHTEGPESELRGDRDLDEEVTEFYHLLCRHIRHMTAITPETRPGYLDVRVEPGTHWEDELFAELARCRVFVPLFSPRYFESEFCGKEWEAFRRREQAHEDTSRRRSAIVPVIWTDISDLELPACASRLQYYDPQIGAAYKKRGIYGLMFDRPTDYRRAAFRITQSIIAVAKTTGLPPCDVSLFADLPNAFEDGPDGP
jgi:hypothetical protein